MDETLITVTPESGAVAISDSLLALVRALKPAQLNLMTARSNDQFNEAFAALVLDAVATMERSSSNLETLGEEGLSDFLAASINGTQILLAKREENSNGHADLVFDAPLCVPARRVLGEAKIYRGYEWHKKGLEQLVQRYATGREKRSLLIAFVKKNGIKVRMERLRAKMDELLPCAQVGDCSDSLFNWSFLSRHTHSSQEEVEVWHLGCNLCPAGKPEDEVDDDEEEQDDFTSEAKPS